MTVLPDSVTTTPGLASGAAELSHDLIRTLKLLYSLRDRAPRLTPGLEPAAHPLLHHLARCETARVSDLATALRADVSTISRYASALAAAGLVEKTTDPADRRVQVVALTDAGRDAVAALGRQRETTFASILRDWTPEQLERFRADLLRFSADLEREVAERELAPTASH